MHAEQYGNLKKNIKMKGVKRSKFESLYKLKKTAENVKLHLPLLSSNWTHSAFEIHN
jgi:hypothetical protein